MKPLLHWLSPGGTGGRLSTLIFHRVLDRPDPLFPEEIDAARFDQICGWVARWFSVLPLGQALQQLGSGRLPPRALAITFDDGYEDNHRLAAPILRRHGLSATFFIATRFLDGGCMWNDRVIEGVRAAKGPRLRLDGEDAGPLAGDWDLSDHAARRRTIDTLIGRIKYLDPTPRLRAADAVLAAAACPRPSGLMMSSEQVRDLLRQGMTVGAHTESHPILARLSEADARREIEGGKQQLEAIIGEPVTLFAYPNGKPGTDYTPETVALARAAGFDAAVSTAWGAADAATDRFQLPRFTPWDRGRTRFALRLAANLRHAPTYA